MYDGKQVLRVETKYKSKDLYNIGLEMNKRKGTGNYDKDRTKFNVEYVSLTERNLYQQVKETLKNRNIEYLNKPNTNLLNGITFTSGAEFFESLGMKFAPSGRTYKTGIKKGQNVKVPVIKSKEDIPLSVTNYFNSCMEFLESYVGEENIILAQVHYDEDTPHLQAYFLPIVNQVDRKCFVKDKDGKVVKEEVIKKTGEVTIVPKLLRDSKGKIVYETVKGKFLNNDQFWKDKGGKNSYAKLQDLFNKFITERGFNLDRGNIGASVEHKTKLEFQIEENKAELEELKQEKENTLKVIKTSKNNLIKAQNEINKTVLNPKKNIVGYNSNDVLKIIEYSKNLEQINIYQKNELETKDNTINKLSLENESLKNNEELIKRNKVIEEQNNKIKAQNEEIKEQKAQITTLDNSVNYLTRKISKLKEKLENEVNKWKSLLFKVCSALDKVLFRKPKQKLEDYERLADAINNDRYDYVKNEEKQEIRPEKKNKSKDDFDLSL